MNTAETQTVLRDAPGGAAAAGIEPARLETATQQSREAVAELASAIRDLPEREQLVLSLYYKDGLTEPEVAEVLGLSPASVSRIRDGAHARLRAAAEHGQLRAA